MTGPRRVHDMGGQDAGPIETPDGRRPRLGLQAGQALFVFEQVGCDLAHAADILLGHEHAVPLVAEEFRQAAGPRRDRHHPAGHRLERG